MSSSNKEISNSLKIFIDMGVVGVEMNTVNNKVSNVKYDKLGTLDEILSSSEIQTLPNSRNMQIAVSNGCRTGGDVIEYCNKIAKEKEDEAIKIGKDVVVDIIGMFSCQNPYEECSWDMVYEMVTPKRELLYIRTHCY